MKLLKDETLGIECEMEKEKCNKLLKFYEVKQ